MRSTLLTVFLFFMLAVEAQQSLPTHTLLWRIQGNQLEKPCYLFGTMHLKTRGIFYFSDSLYAALENTDGFAMEVHPDSMVALVLRHVFEKYHQKMLKDLVTKEDLAKIDTRTRKVLGIPADELTKKDAYLLKEQLSVHKSREDDMPTFMDAYLYGLAKDQGKRVAGLERAEDQEALLEGMEDSFDPRSLADTDDSKTQKFSDNFVQVYKEQNLPRLDSIFRFESGGMDLFALDKRNHVMVRSMDSLFHTGSYLVAVGAAHLSGDDGLIRLLREKGYSVEPVFSMNKVQPGTYTFHKKSVDSWVKVKVPEEGYEVEMPGKPQDFPQTAGASMKMYMDLTRVTFFESGSGPQLFNLKGTQMKRDSLLQVSLKAMTDKIKGIVLHSSPIIQDSVQGLDAEVEIPSSQVWMNTRILMGEKRVYFFIVGAQKKGTIQDADKERFFHSLKFFEPVNDFVPRKMEFGPYYVSITLPGKDEEQVFPEQESQHFTYHLYSDPVTGNVFSLTLLKANPGYTLSGDSVYLYSTLDNFKKRWVNSVLTTHDTAILGYRSLWVEGDINNGSFLRGLIIKRENYEYSMFAFGTNQTSVRAQGNAFFQSLTLVPFGKNPWRSYDEKDQGYEVQAPGYVLNRHNKDSTELREWADSVRMETFSLRYEVMNPYSFSASDTAYLKQQFSRVHAKKLLSRYTFSMHQGLPYIDFTVPDDQNKGFVERGRIYLNGNRTYFQYAYLLDGRETLPEVNGYFDSLHFTHPSKPEGLSLDGPGKFLGDLYSSDTAVRARAADFLDTAVFAHQDLPAILGTLQKKFPEDSAQYWDEHRSLLNDCKSLAGDSDLALLGNVYRELPGKGDMGYTLLDLVSNIKTRAAEDSLIALLSYRLPGTGDAYAVVRNLEDTLALAKGVCARLFPFQNDSSLGMQLFYLYNRLLDSGTMTLSDFIPQEQNFLNCAYRYAGRPGQMKNDPDGDFDVMTDFIKRFGDTAATRFFKAGQDIPTMEDKFSSVCALLFMGHNPKPEALKSIAAEARFRVELFDSLSHHGKKASFPEAYLNQKAFAETYLQKSRMEDEDDDDNVSYDDLRLSFIKEGIYPYHGKKAKFLIFDGRAKGQDTSLLCVVGPYAPGSRKLELDADSSITGVYYVHRLDRKNIDTQVKAYLDMYSGEGEKGPDTNEEDNNK